MTCILIIVSLGVYLLACCGKREKKESSGAMEKKIYKKESYKKKRLHRRRARFFFSLSLSLSASHPLSLLLAHNKKAFFLYALTHSMARAQMPVIVASGP